MKPVQSQHLMSNKKENHIPFATPKSSKVIPVFSYNLTLLSYDSGTRSFQTSIRVALYCTTLACNNYVARIALLKSKLLGA